jgi:hypothetical protein
MVVQTDCQWLSDMGGFDLLGIALPAAFMETYSEFLSI